ncbi:type VI secretion system tube protein Hcp [Salmonella enterica]|uniref:Type VI secretion system tube protein Hcp n=5 Tax=Salmonella enterica subsp. salamae TaxID=59202 RepID=A0A5Y1WGF4_SALER|nr:type VI secretion system tube protein TssD [Salmonella enterica]EAA4436826.1 type VI secretion system tube protein Hcp [Salmonella enterica subsp. salamae]ECG1420222.1 type VI secretion system tube protein Hcp [Salmonella enterica subsp. salamae str. CFSAN000559]EEJ4592331.1 type VI secretion system tube protein Hcp [Salmonella enterica subsp. salamae serovar 47:b:e,n,x,z15]EKR2154313.1 type VI secretion system tube protein Hcp [Salmonella enterica subsp. salamae serovar 40:c:z6]HAC6410785.
MGNLIYLTLEGNIQGQISAGCSSQASVGNRHQLGHENAIFVFSLTQAASGSQSGIHHHGLHFCKLLDKSSPLLSNAINNNERLKMIFDIYRINRYGRMEKYYLIELRGATIQAISLQSKMNDMDYEYITIDYDYILCRHLIAGTEFDYLLTPDNYAHLFPAVQKTILPRDPPERKVTLVLGIFFDGTGNNAVNTRNMLEALTAQHFDINDPDAESILTRNVSEKMGVSGIGAGSYLGYYTNIHWLNELYEQTFPPDGGYMQGAVYVEGIGTRAGEPDNPIGLGLGTAETGIIAKTDEAVAQLAKAIDATLALLQGKFVVDKLLFDIFGFSRGAAAARHFANRIQSEDRAIINAISAGMGKISYRGAPAGKTRFLGIMDTVAAVGTLANGLDPHSADTGNVNIHLRPGVAQKVFHLTALHECRYNFALNSVAPAWPELALPGVHSDIGGGYLPQLREDLFLTRPQVDTLPQNQSGAQSHIYPQTMAQLQVLEHSPAIMPIIRTNAITPEVWEDDFAPPDRYSQPQKRAFAALTLRHRIVSFDWSKVALRVMVDAATEAGAVFDDISQIPKHRLPDELKPFCEHARLMGKAARQHVAATGFAPEDINIIAGKYIHCSAHWNAVELKQSGELQGGASASKTVSFVNRPDKNWIRTIYNMDGKKR